MRWMLFLLFFISAVSLQGQYDSLYQLPFNKRFKAFRNEIWPYFLNKDSLRFIQKMDSLTSFAKSKNNRGFLLEVELMVLEKNTDTSNPDLEKLEKSFQNLLQKVSKTTDQRLMALVHYYFGNFYWGRKKDFSLAIQFYEKAYSLAKELKDEDFFFKQQIIYKLGEKYFYLTDYPNSIRFFNEASKVNNQWMPLHPNISIYNTKGLAHRSMGQIDSAEYCFIKALEFAKEAEAKVWIGTLSGNLGGIYIKKGDLKKGLELLRVDEKISQQRRSKSSAAGAMLEIARVSLLQGKVDEAIRLLDSSLLLTKGKIPYPRKRSFYQLKSDIHKYKGDYENALLYLDSTSIVRDSLARQDSGLRTLRLKQRIELEESRSDIANAEAENRRKTILLYSVIIGLIITLFGGLLLLRQKRKTERAKKRSDELLLNILPSDVAAELKATGSAKAKRFQDVTVLFSDFKSFTTYAENMKPEELVNILDDYFRIFDSIVEDLGLEKIKTIGDAYMCVCGLPHPDPLHAEKIIRAAIRMQEAIKNNSNGWQLRIGIHSGPVVAGIVGHKKFAYDIWGDTVNVAARMESNSEQGKINISKDTYNLITDTFNCTYRGKLKAKNKGDLEMYFVDNVV